MATKAEKIRAGVFVTVGAFLVIGAFAVIAGVRVLKSHTVYYVEFSGSVSGLAAGTSVTYKGVPVGAVDEIQFVPNDIEKIRVSLLIVPGTPIKSDARATIKSKGITGGTLLELYGGTNDSPLLRAGETIPADRPFLEALTYDVPELLKNLQSLLVDLRGITTPENQQKVAVILSRAEILFGSGTDSLLEAAKDISLTAKELSIAAPKVTEAVTEMNSIVSDVGGSLRQGAASFQVAAANTRHAVQEADLPQLGKDLRAVGTNLRRWTDENSPAGVLAAAETAVADLGNLIADLRRTVNGNGEVITSTVENLHESTLVLQDFLKIVRSNPGVLLSPPRPQD